MNTEEDHLESEDFESQTAEQELVAEETADEAEQVAEAEVEATEELDPYAALEQDVLKWKDAALRAKAELENFRKRMAKEKADSIKFGNQRLIEELLPVIDNFNMGMTAAEQDAESMIYRGMQMVQQQLDGFLTSQGVSEIGVKPGDVFDHNLHDAMSQEESESYEDGQVIRVMRKGFKMVDRLVRPATVVVAQSKPEEASAEENEAQEA